MLRCVTSLRIANFVFKPHVEARNGSTTTNAWNQMDVAVVSRQLSLLDFDILSVGDCDACINGWHITPCNTVHVMCVASDSPVT